MNRHVYLDNNATTPLDPDVLAAFSDALARFGNPSSMHGFGREAASLVSDARAEAAAILGAEPGEITCTSGGTESNNTVLASFAPGIPATDGVILPPPGRDEIIVSAIEHPAILETAFALRDRFGMTVHLAPVDATGRIDLAAFERLVNDKTALVSVMLANNEIGTIQDLTAISAIAHKAGAFVHTDAVQAVGKIPVDVTTLGVDYLSASGHKIHGPKGIGILWMRRGVPFAPLMHGGHQEQGRRAGTVNAPAIAALGTACRIAREQLATEARRLAGLRDRLRAGIEERISDTSINGNPDFCLPNTLNMSFRAAEGESTLLYLDLENIAVSTGSACASGSLEPSHVLLACGRSAELAHGSIRFSLGRTTSDEDIEYVLDKLPPIMARIRSMSTLR
ncbi:MAG TPA: aminotransferase class V-fold PLP-dependent enzyme [Spirochaetota bacterium]|nr:aminotransferase class V-fold PLP-dependent enzyme [Spirochaetota bacterium]